jgi:hypothetical protein
MEARRQQQVLLEVRAAVERSLLSGQAQLFLLRLVGLAARMVGLAEAVGLAAIARPLVLDGESLGATAGLVGLVLAAAEVDQPQSVLAARHPRLQTHAARPLAAVAALAVLDSSSLHMSDRESQCATHF